MWNTGTVVFRTFWIHGRLDPQMWTGGLTRKSFKKPFLELTCEQVTRAQVQTFNPSRTGLYDLGALPQMPALCPREERTLDCAYFIIAM